MKRLIVCFDGTWNNPQQEDNGIPSPTNVYKISNAIVAGSVGDDEQRVYYHPGVGGEDQGLVEKALGGAIGAGIRRHIRSAYHWLATNYEEGDQIYFFGFSRGAFTVRSICGMVSRGLLDLRGCPSNEGWERVEKAFDAYRKKQDEWAEGDWAFFNGGNPAKTRFIGVWDTVGALGIPDDFEVLNLLDDRENWRFHDTELSEHVQTARHAMALDEIRSSFTVTRWTNASSHLDAKEVWFPGCHSDVGGGYDRSELSDGALRWMIDEAREAGLGIRGDLAAFIKPNPLGPIHNSFKAIFAKLRSRPRRVESIGDPGNRDLFHSSAHKRRSNSPIAHGPYWPTKALDIGDPEFKTTVYADTRWNCTGIFLEPGEYRFRAEGEWKDSKDACDWKGTGDGKLTMGDAVRGVSSFLGTFESVFKKFTKNKSTDFLGTKRVEALPWFTLVGAIANDGAASAGDDGQENDGSPTPHQYVQLCKYEIDPLVVSRAGYLYCFPNDVWTLYKNNRGSVDLFVKRVR